MRCGERQIVSSKSSIANTRGFTLIELLVFLLVFMGLVMGATTGARLAAGHGTLWQVFGAIGGGVAGALSVIAVFFLIFLPFIIAGAVRRAFEPADLVCRCEQTGAAA